MLRNVDPLGLDDAPYERYGENAWGDQGFEDFSAGRVPAGEQGADIVFEADSLTAKAPPGEAVQHRALYQNTPERNPETRGRFLEKQLVLDTAVTMSEIGVEMAGVALDLGTMNATPLPFAEMTILRRADQIGEAMLDGRRLAMSSELREAAATFRGTNAIEPGRNVAASAFEAGGKIVDGPLLSVSGKSDEIAGAVRQLVKPILEPQQAGGYVRAFDSEYKIFQNFADQYSTSTKGVLHVYTERPACDSCVNVGAQLEQIFPGVRVQLYNGPHVR